MVEPVEPPREGAPAAVDPAVDHIVVVDDEELQLRLLRVQLERVLPGRPVHAFSDGEEALRFLDEHGADLVLTDLVMPGLSGLDLITEVHERDDLLPVVVLTGYFDRNERETLTAAGAEDFLTKPVREEDLGRRLEVVLEKARTTRRLRELERAVAARPTLVGISEASRALRERIRGEAGKAPHPAAAGFEGVAIGRRPAEAGVEAEKSENAQIILAHPLFGVPDKANAARPQILDAAKIVDEPAAPIDTQGVDGEVAARGVFPKIVGEFDVRMASVAGDIPPERGDLERAAVDDRRHRAMVDACRNRFHLSGFEPFHDLIREERRRDIEIDLRVVLAQERIAHAAADEARRHAARGQHVHQLPAAVGREPGRRHDHRGGHRLSSLEKPTSMPAVAPQINRPS